MSVFWLLLGLGSLFAAFAMPPLVPEWEALQQPILFGFAAICSILWLVALFRKPKTPSARPILIDGSNVMHWRKGQPDIKIVKQLVQALIENGHRPGVVFDANVGYKLSDRYMHDAALARLLGLPVKQVMVSPKGTPADQFLLQAARDMDAPIITNDRFRDWQDDFPEVANAGRLIRGGVRGRSPYLKTAP